MQRVPMMQSQLRPKEYLSHRITQDDPEWRDDDSANDTSPASSTREMGTNGGRKATMRDRLSIDPLRNLRDASPLRENKLN